MNFSSWSYRVKHKEMLVVYPIGIMLYQIVSVIDQYVAPEAYREVLVPLHRYILPLLLVSVLLALYRQKSQTFLNYHIALNAMFAMGVNSVIISSIELFTIYHTVMYFLILWTFLFAGLTLKHAFLTVIVGMVFNVIGISFCSELPSAEFWFHLFWILASTIFGASGNVMMYYSHKNQYKQQLKIEQALQQKGVLLKELAHRVKNNLQMVSGILYAQARKIEDADYKAKFKEGIETISAMGKLHEMLYVSDDTLGLVNFKAYVEAIFESMSKGRDAKHITLHIQSDEILLSITEAMPLGLVIHEIFTNTLKHAVITDNKELSITFEMKKHKGSEIFCHVYDNGDTLDIKNIKKGYGMELIESLVKFQLGGSLECYGNEGLHYNIAFACDKNSTPHS